MSRKHYECWPKPLPRDITLFSHALDHAIVEV